MSCFTATAKQRVITDISDYFLSILGINLELFATQEARVNLRYEVIFVKSNKEKYPTLRDLIISKNCPTIVYASRTKKTEELAERLNFDGITARAFNGKMKSQDKIINQEAFINNEVQVIVATSAFGMGG